MTEIKPRKPSVPPGLSERARRTWRATVADFEMSASELEVLRSALIALDRADAAAKIVRAEGLTVRDRFGGVKAHPAVDVELRQRAMFGRLVKQLGIELEEPGAESPVTRKARSAARARWGHVHRLSEARRARGAL